MGADRPLQRVLIIEDDADYRKLLLTWLSALYPGVEVIEYDPPAQGAPAQDFDWSKFDVLLLDYNLGLENASGLDILRAGQAHPSFPATLMLTSAGNEEVAVQALKTGVEDYLRKEHLTRDMLRSAMENAYTRHHLKHQRVSLQAEMREIAQQESEKLIGDYKNKLMQLRALEEKRMHQERQRMEREIEAGKQQLARIEEEQKHAELSRRVLLDEIQKLKEELKAAGEESNVNFSLQSTRERYMRVSEETRRLQENMERAVAKVDKNRWKLELTRTQENELARELEEFREKPAPAQESDAETGFNLQRRSQAQEQVGREKQAVRDKDAALLKDIAAQLKKDR
jgi:DNA-binding response OmpR family regulator